MRTLFLLVSISSWRISSLRSQNGTKSQNKHPWAYLCRVAKALKTQVISASFLGANPAVWTFVYSSISHDAPSRSSKIASCYCCSNEVKTERRSNRSH
ncbi:hypothetical protein K456DRAFT_88774 [Colletotrichum gloeosporioides 23]|nr:hypothetical protein K456DRAFT_88774 [Colletotrichum gloeosporioides 23]